MPHTHEPWRVGIDVYGNAAIVAGLDEVIFSNTGRGFSEPTSADLARITACVNACAGIPSSALEANVVQEMLQACKALWADRDASQDDQAACRRLYNAWKDLGSIIAKATTKES